MLLKRINKDVQLTKQSTSETAIETVKNAVTSTGIENSAGNIHTKNSFQFTEPNCRKLYKSLVCSICGKKLSAFKVLHIHMENHKGPSEWKWGCKKCGKRFPVERSLRRHFRIHTEERSFVCRFCGIKYSRKTSLRDHLKKRHGDEKDLDAELARWDL